MICELVHMTIIDQHRSKLVELRQYSILASELKKMLGNSTLAEKRLASSSTLL